MAVSKKSYSFFDVVKYSRPNVFNIDVPLTAAALSVDEGKRFFAYSSVFPRIDHFIRHRVTEAYLAKTFNFYSDN